MKKVLVALIFAIATASGFHISTFRRFYESIETNKRQPEFEDDPPCERVYHEAFIPLGRIMIHDVIERFVQPRGPEPVLEKATFDIEEICTNLVPYMEIIHNGSFFGIYTDGSDCSARLQVGVVLAGYICSDEGKYVISSMTSSPCFVNLQEVYKSKGKNPTRCYIDAMYAVYNKKINECDAYDEVVNCAIPEMVEVCGGAYAQMESVFAEILFNYEKEKTGCEITCLPAHGLCLR